MSQIKLVAKKGAALNIIMILMMMMMMSVKPFRHHSTNYTNVKYLDQWQIFNICQYLVKLPSR